MGRLTGRRGLGLTVPTRSDAEILGYLGQTMDPNLCNASQIPALGSLLTSRIYVPKSGLCSFIWGFVTGSAGAGLVAGQNGYALYSDDGQRLLASSADMTVPWGTTGAKPAAWSAPVGLVGDTFYRAVMLVNGTTAPNFRAGQAGATATNLGLAVPRNGTMNGGGGVTAFPAALDTPGLPNLNGTTGASWLWVLT